MQEPIRIVEIGTPATGITGADWLSRAEIIHRQLRPQLPQDYAGKIAAIVRDGAVVCIAVCAAQVLGVGVYRVYENSHVGRRCYVDDLVIDESQRSMGVGKQLLEYIAAVARDNDCESLELESGSQRAGAHRFYFREGFVITGFSFRKRLR